MPGTPLVGVTATEATYAPGPGTCAGSTPIDTLPGAPGAVCPDVEKRSHLAVPVTVYWAAAELEIEIVCEAGTPAPSVAVKTRPAGAAASDDGVLTVRTTGTAMVPDGVVTEAVVL